MRYFLTIIFVLSIGTVNQSHSDDTCIPGAGVGIGKDLSKALLCQGKLQAYKEHIANFRRSDFTHDVMEKNLQDQVKLCNVKFVHLKKKPPLKKRKKKSFRKLCPSKKGKKFQYQAGFFDHNQAGPGVALVDFANKVLGGGTIHGGLLQEEKMLLQTNVLPLLHRTKYRDLDKNPLIMDLWWTHEFTGAAKKFYGSKSLPYRRTSPHSIPPLYQKLAHPKQVRVLAMAALEKPSSYNQKNIRQMFQTALKSFAGHKKRGGKKVVTGRWGCGGFNNNCRATTVLQLMAAQCAGVSLDFYGGDQRVFSDAQDFLIKHRKKKLGKILKLLATSSVGSDSPLPGKSSKLPKKVVFKEPSSGPSKIEDGQVLSSLFTPIYDQNKALSDHAPVLYRGNRVGTWNITYQGMWYPASGGRGAFYNHGFKGLTISDHLKKDQPVEVESDAWYEARMLRVAQSLCDIFTRNPQMEIMNLQEVGFKFPKDPKKGTRNQTIIKNFQEALSKPKCTGADLYIKWGRGTQAFVYPKSANPRIVPTLEANTTLRFNTLRLRDKSRAYISIHASYNTASPSQFCSDLLREAKKLKAEGFREILISGDFNKAYSTAKEGETGAVLTNLGFKDEPACKDFVFHTSPGEKDYHSSSVTDPKNHERAGRKNIDLMLEYK